MSIDILPACHITFVMIRVCKQLYTHTQSYRLLQTGANGLEHKGTDNSGT